MNKVFALLVLAVMGLFFASLALGPQEMTGQNWWAAFLGRGASVDQIILWQIRAPRSLLALLVGAGLGASGAALQGLLRNPLADPAVVGISSSASLFAAFFIYSGLAANYHWSIFVGAMLGAGVAAVFLWALSLAKATASTLILGGVALSAMATSLTALMMNLSPNPWALSEIAYWLMGSVADRSFVDVMMAGPFIGLGILVLHGAGRGLDLLNLGEETAATSGISLGRTGRLVVLGSMLCVGAGVAVAGAVGFVGLAAPHMVRPFVGYQAGRLVFPSAILGGALLLLADMVSRWLSAPGTPLYLGVVTALLGAPLFLFLLWRIQKEQI